MLKKAFSLVVWEFVIGLKMKYKKEKNENVIFGTEGIFDDVTDLIEQPIEKIDEENA
ncbi:hypothetical protein F6350_001064 [Enterococcus faecium]|nr:hypothetical protein [Enterococcus faecium]